MRSLFLCIIFITNLTCYSQGFINKGKDYYQKYLRSYESGNFIPAQEYLDSILPFLDSLSSYHQSLINNSQGIIYRKLGQFKEAQKAFTKSLIICRKSNEGHPELECLILNNHGILYKDLGDYENALVLFSKAKEVIQNHSNEFQYNPKPILLVLYNEAITHFRLGSFNKAIEGFEESLKISIHLNDGLTGSVYFNIARSYDALELAESASCYYIKSINAISNYYSLEDHRLGGVYLNYGQFLINQNRDRLGLSYFDKSIGNYLRNYGHQHSYTASTYNFIASYHIEKQEFETGFNYIQQALSSVCPGFVSSSIFDNPVDQEALLDLRLLKIYKTKIESLSAYAAYINNGEKVSDSNKEPVAYLELAIETAKDAIRVLDKLQHSYLNQESRLFLDENQKDIFITGIANALQLYDLTGNKSYQQMAYLFASRGKTLELSYEMHSKQELYLQSLPDTITNQLTTLKEDLDSYTSMIQMEQIKVNPDSARISEWKSKRFDLNRLYEKSYRKVFGENLRPNSIKNWDATSNIQEVQSKLARNESMIEYSLSEPDSTGSRILYSFVFSRRSFVVNRKKVDSGFMDDLSKVQTQLTEYHSMFASKDGLSELSNPLAALYNNLIEPIENYFVGNKILIIPDDELLKFPFSALIQTNTETVPSSSGFNYLIEKFEISYALNAEQVKQRKRKLFHSTPELKVLANDYMQENSQPDKSGMFSVKKLHATNRETNTILALANGKRISQDLNKSEIIEEIASAEILHFAMHAFPSMENLSSSYLALNSNTDSTYSHLLFDYEIEPLQLQTKMVVLNACETGHGVFHQGEGMLSMSRSFILGGAQSVIHTQWPVDDATSYKIITQLYEGLFKGWSKSKSLRQAQIRYLEDASPSFRHPYYWAAYQVVGNPDSITSQKDKRIIVISLVALGIIIWILRVRRKEFSKINAS